MGIDVRAMLAAHDPAATLTPDEVDRSAEITLRQILDSAPPGEPQPQVRRARRRPAARRAIIATAVLATLSLSLVVADATIRRSTVDPVTVAAIEATAEVALASSDPGRLTPGRIWYERTISRYPRTVAVDGGSSDYVVLVSVAIEVWTAADGSQRHRSRMVGEPAFRSETDRRKWQTHGSPAAVFAVDLDTTLRPGEQGVDPLRDYRDLMRLPTDADALFAHFERAATGADAGTYPEMFELVQHALRVPAPIPPSLRAALYRVLARIPGVRLIERTTDMLGRPVSAIALPRLAPLGLAESQDLILFDPRTAEPLGTRLEMVRNLMPAGDPAGTVLGHSTVEARGFVASMDSTQP
jgi:hypothetical protein